MKMLFLFATVLLLTACDTNRPDTLIDSGYDQQEMDAAISRARQEVDAFIAELASPTGEDHAVKAPITDQGKTEHFWINQLKYNDGKFTGIINNDSGLVTNVKIGDSWTVSKSDISDWMFMRDGKMHGNYTMRPLLKTLPKEQADQFRAILAEP